MTDTCELQIKNAVDSINDCLNKIMSHKVHSEHILYAISLHAFLFQEEALYRCNHEVRMELQETIDRARRDARQYFNDHQKPYFDGINRLNPKTKQSLK
jgi:hypothetical protein